MRRKYRAALNCGLCVVTGVGAGILYFLGAESLAASSEAAGDEGIAARIDSYCDAVRSWQSGTSEELDNFLFFARLGPGIAGPEVPCSLSSVPNFYDRPASEVSEGKCNDYEVKTVRCNVSELIASPVPDSLYTIELVGKEPGRLTATIGQAVIQVLTERVWDLVDAVKARHCGAGADFDCPRRTRQMFCEELQGRPVDDEYRECRAQHRLARASEKNAPCWVVQPNLGVDKTFTFANMQWPEQDDSVHPITADAPFRCTWGTNISSQLFVQHMTATSLDSSAMPDILDDAELTFRHHKDPFVVASRLTQSTFNMVLPEVHLRVSIVVFFMWAVFLNCCCCGSCFKACVISDDKVADDKAGPEDVVPTQAADADRDSNVNPTEEDASATA